MQSLDKVAYNDLGLFIEKNKVGNAILAGDLKEANIKLANFLDDGKLEKYKKNTKLLFNKEFEIKNAYDAIIKNINGDEVDV